MNRKIVIPVLVIGAATAAYLYEHGAANGRLRASGTIEARNIDVGSKEGGRVVEVAAREGDRVEAGQLLVRFDDAELQGRLTQARANVGIARATLEKMEHGSRPEEIAEARAAADDEPGAGYRGAEVAAVQADLKSAQAELVNARRNHERAVELRKNDLGSQLTVDETETNLRAAQEKVNSLEHAVAAAAGRLSAAQAVTARIETGNRSEDIDAARAELLHAEGVLQEAEARYLEREVRAPAAAAVEVLDLRPGDLVAPGAIVARLLESDQLYVIVFVPETRVGAVRVGQQADLKTDSFGDAVFASHVEQIRQQAEFLPRNVQTAEERVHQVIGVKLRVDDPGRQLRAGMSADVVFHEEAGS